MSIKLRHIDYKGSIVKKILIVFLCFIMLFTSITFVLQNSIKEDSLDELINDELLLEIIEQVGSIDLGIVVLDQEAIEVIVNTQEFKNLLIEYVAGFIKFLRGGSKETTITNEQIIELIGNNIDELKRIGFLNKQISSEIIISLLGYIDFSRFLIDYDELKTNLLEKNQYLSVLFLMVKPIFLIVECAILILLVFVLWMISNKKVIDMLSVVFINGVLCVVFSIILMFMLRNQIVISVGYPLLKRVRKIGYVFLLLGSVGYVIYQSILRKQKVISKI